MHSRDPVAGTWNLLARGSGGTDGPRFPVSRLRRIVRVAKGGRVLLRPQTATRTCIIVRTITLQLAWTPLKGLISCKRIEVSGIVKTVFRASPWSYILQKPLLGLPAPSPTPSSHNLCRVWYFLATGTQTSPAAPRAPCPQ